MHRQVQENNIASFAVMNFLDLSPSPIDDQTRNMFANLSLDVPLQGFDLLKAFQDLLETNEDDYVTRAVSKFVIAVAS